MNGRRMSDRSVLPRKLSNKFADNSVSVVNVEALNLLLCLDDGTAAVIYAKSLKGAAAKLSSVPRVTLTGTLRHADFIVLATLDCMRDESLQSGALELLLAHLKAGAVSSEMWPGAPAEVG